VGGGSPWRRVAVGGGSPWAAGQSRTGLAGGPRRAEAQAARDRRPGDGLTLPQFLERWRGRAGLVGATPIPDALRGLAYVQNHPLAEEGREWAYDAIDEVYFDDADSLLARIAYFQRELTGGADSDLVRANWFLAVSEDPIRLPL